MADLTTTVRFIGDASQLLATMRTLGAQGQALQNSINKATNLQIPKGFNTQMSGTGLNQIENIGPIVKGVSTEFDALNKTFRRTTQTAIAYRDANKEIQEIMGGQLKTTFGDFTNISERLGQVEGRNAALSARDIQTTRNRTAAYKSLTQGMKDQARAAISSINAAEKSGLLEPSNARYLRGREVERFKNFLGDPNITNARTNALAAYNKELTNVVKGQDAVGRSIDRAFNAAPPIPASFKQIQQISPSLVKQLQGQGLDTNPAALYTQGFNAQLDRDLVTGVKKVRGEFTDAAGFTNRFNAELDNSGNVVTRFGRNMSGLQNFLRQTVANFQKVIQWTVATTAVFGTLAFAAQELSVLIDVDKTLKQLGVTAQLTSEQTKGLFTDLADIAIQTATPLQDILKASDDIALAVRETGKSAEDYREDILNLTEAVGIYTNLTGQDTVKATDILVASMKQLGLETEDVTGLLSKITAVAGGQSAAIADVATGLGVMAEAARQAGLTIDETIGTVQVLSQVTSKSPAEVATAFKNLVGALDSRAGAKALGEFDIALRDNAGNLRNILDIYGEISDKIRTGIIPAADVKGLVKAIAGGPRRAPDAAALLSAIDDIEQVTQRSIGATNEALIVNAKILDTTAAKLTQLRVEVDKFAFENFGPAFKEASEVFLEAITSVLAVINALPKGLYVVILQIAAFSLALKAAAFGINFLKGSLAGVVGSVLTLGKSFTAAGQQAAAASGQMAMFSESAVTAGAKGKLAALGGGLGKGLGFAAGGAALGAGLTLAGGGSPVAALSSGLQGAGFSLAAFAPLPWLKLAGVVAIAAGTLLDFATAGDKASESMEGTALEAEQVVNAFNKLKEARATIDNLTQTQEEIREGMAAIRGEIGDGSRFDQTIGVAVDPTEQSALDDYQKQYVQNTLEMAAANRELKAAIDDLPDTVGIDFKETIEAAAAGRISVEELERQVQKYYVTLLRAANPDLQIPDDINIAPPKPNLPVLDYDREGAFKTLGGDFLSAKDLAEEPIRVKAIFETEGEFDKGKFIPGIQATKEEIQELLKFASGKDLDEISRAITAIGNSGDAAAPGIRTLFEEVRSGLDAFSDIDSKMASYQTFIDAIAGLGLPQAGGLQKLADLTRDTVAAAKETGDIDAAKIAVQSLYDIISENQGASILDPEKSGEAVGAIALQLIRLTQDMTGVTDAGGILRTVLESFGLVDFAPAAEGIAAIGEVATEEAAKIRELIASIESDNALKLAELQAQFQSGDFKGNEEVYARQVAQLKAVTAGVQEAGEAYAQAQETIPGFDESLGQVAAGLETVNGLQDAANLSASQLIERVYQLAETYGVGEKGTKRLTTKLLDLLATIKRINGIKAAFNIKGNIDLSKVIAGLRATAKALRLLPFGALTSLPFELAAAALASQQYVLNQTTKDVDKIYSGGSGSNFSNIPSGSSGGSSGSKSPSRTKSSTTKPRAKTFSELYDVSEVDVPDAIAGAYNRDALIQEAIRRAKALQSKIPGAAKDAKNDIISVLQGTQKLIEVRGVKDDLLRRALEELAEIEKKRLEFETKADTIRRIRVGAGDFSAIANVPLNTKTGVSLGGAAGPINVSIGLTGQILTPAQMSQLADLIAASLKRQIAA